MARRDDPERLEGPDVEISASAKAKRLRFRGKQKPEGTRRDVRVRWRAVGRVKEPPS